MGGVIDIDTYINRGPEYTSNLKAVHSYGIICELQ